MTTLPATGPEAILAALQSMDLDTIEKEQRAAIASGSKTKRSRAVRLLNTVQGLRVNELKPENLMLRSVPVIPPQFRPFSVTGNTFLPGDSNEVYRDLLEYRRLYQDTERTMGRDGAAESYLDLARAAKAAYGYGDSPNPKTKAREVKGFFKMITGTNPKTCYDDKTEILTQRGWVLFRDLQPDDQVGSIDPDTNGFLWSYFENYVDAPYNGLMVKFDRRRQSLLVTPNHRMWIKKRRRNENVSSEADMLRNWEVVDAARLVYASNRTWTQTAAASYTGGEMTELRSLDIDPGDLAALTGWYASEGNSHGEGVVVWQSDRNMPYCDELEALFVRLQDAGVEVGKWSKEQGTNDDPSTCWGWSIAQGELSRWLIANVGERSHEKKLSAVIRNWPKENLEQMLLAYLKGDGAKRKDGVGVPRRHYTHKFRSPINDEHQRMSTVSKQLFDDLQEVSFKLGLTLVRICEDSSQAGRYGTNTREIYCGGLIGRWNFTSDNQTPGEWEEYEGRIYCVQVPTGLLVVRREGKVCVSGNSFYQQKMISKPVDTVGRGVIVPDADLGMDEVGIPEDMAWKLYGNYVQRRLVRSGMPPASALKHLMDRTPMARKALDDELDVEVDKQGHTVPRRPVVITRSPAWHRTNVIGQTARLVPGDAIRINTFITDGMNADFDGDCKSLKENDLWKIMNEIYYGSFEELLPRLGLGIPATSSLLTLADGALEVVSFVDGAATWLPVSHVHFHTAHGASVKVTFNTGFDLVTTDDHGMMVYDDEMNLKQVAPQSPECRVVPVAKRIPAPALHESVTVGARQVLLDYDFGYVVGHYLGDGGAYDNNEHVRIMSDDPEHLRVLPRRFGDFRYSEVHAHTKHKGFRLLDKDLWEWFRGQFGSGSFEKRVASWVYGSPEAFRRGLLDGVLSTDGHLKVGRTSATVCICLSNEVLMHDLAVVCRTLGVWCSMEVSPVRAARRLHLDADDMPWLELTHPGRNRTLTEVRNLRNLKVRQYTKLVPWGKNLRDRWLSELGVGVSVARVSHSIFGSVYAAKGHASLLVARQFCATRATPPKDACLRRWWDLVHSDVTCCTLVGKVDVIEREPVTFDVTVPETHLTVGPVNGVVTHQTMSVHVPTTDAAVRDVREKLMASKMLWSIKDRSKTNANPKHEQILGLSMGQLPGGKRHKFASDDEAMAAIESGQVDLNDDIEITK